MYIDDISVKEVSKKTYKSSLNIFKKYIDSNKIKSPTKEDIVKYKNFIDSKNYSLRSKARHLVAVKSFFKWLNENGLYADVSKNVSMFYVPSDLISTPDLKIEDIQTILNKIDRSTEVGARDYAMILLSVTGGLRIIEMQRANIEDMQMIRGQKVLYIQGKGHDEKDDYIKLCPAVMDALNKYLSFKGPIKKTDPLFTGTSNRAKNKRISEPSISRIIKDRFIDAGYDCNKLSSRSLRVTGINLMIENTNNLNEVKHFARHTVLDTTDKYLKKSNQLKTNPNQTVANLILGGD